LTINPSDPTVTPSSRPDAADGCSAAASHHTFQVLAFDCDGVLFDSRDANTRFYSHILKTIGLPPVRPEQQGFIHMHPVRESLHFLLPEEKDFQKAWEYTQTIDFKAFNSYLTPEPGLVAFLESVRDTHHIAMATNRTVSTRDVLDHFNLSQYFDLVVSASDVRFPKPHPESMERILETFRVEPHEVLYVGDSQVDEALALSTGVFFVAYKNPSLTARCHISHFSELHAII
jgi:HAD superfamily hydrolase (TIGR01509 family)